MEIIPWLDSRKGHFTSETVEHCYEKFITTFEGNSAEGLRIKLDYRVYREGIDTLGGYACEIRRLLGLVQPDHRPDELLRKIYNGLDIPTKKKVMEEFKDRPPFSYSLDELLRAFARWDGYDNMDYQAAAVVRSFQQDNNRYAAPPKPKAAPPKYQAAPVLATELEQQEVPPTLDWYEDLEQSEGEPSLFAAPDPSAESYPAEVHLQLQPFTPKPTPAGNRPVQRNYWTQPKQDPNLLTATQRIRQLEQQVTRLLKSKQNPTEPVGCFRCKDPDHMIKDCPIPAPSGNGNSAQPEV
jgi:Zinc knuckle